jgi:hypothetical protein
VILGFQEAAEAHLLDLLLLLRLSCRRPRWDPAKDQLGGHLLQHILCFHLLSI